jgi:hypothetical protein
LESLAAMNMILNSQNHQEMFFDKKLGVLGVLGG